jgi:hypothetical protein
MVRWSNVFKGIHCPLIYLHHLFGHLFARDCGGEVLFSEEERVYGEIVEERRRSSVNPDSVRGRVKIILDWLSGCFYCKWPQA